MAINRRVDSPSPEASVVDGSVNQILFPIDPASHGPAIVATLGRIFPEAEGHLVIGPMLQIAWGGRILSLSVAIIVDMPSPFQLIIIGRVELALPDPAAPLVLLEATVVGAFEFSPNFSVVVVASHGKDGKQRTFPTFPRHGYGDLYDSIPDIRCTWTLYVPSRRQGCRVCIEFNWTSCPPAFLACGRRPILP